MNQGNRKRRHRLDMGRGELLAEELTVKAALQVMHARIEKNSRRAAQPKAASCWLSYQLGDEAVDVEIGF